MHAVEDGSRLDKFTITRTLSKAADSIISYFREHGVDAAYRISVSHADALADARFFIDRLKNAFPNTELELLKPLSHRGDRSVSQFSIFANRVGTLYFCIGGSIWENKTEETAAFWSAMLCW